MLGYILIEGKKIYYFSERKEQVSEPASEV